MSKQLSTTTPSEDNVPADIAPPPFNKPTADVILRTSDRVDFKVHKLILSEASSFFETMFSLPQNVNDAGQSDSLPVIPVAQNQKVIDNLLRFCYPVAIPQITALTDLLDLVAAASFYQMDSIGEGFRQMVLTPSLLSQDPFRVYAIACGTKWKDGAKAAVRTLLESDYPTQKVPPYHPAMEDISGADLHRLWSYFHRCGLAARALTKPENMTWVPAGLPWFGKKKCSHCTNTEQQLYQCEGVAYFYARTWWMDYMAKIGEELESRPLKATVLTGYGSNVPWVVEALQCECGPEVREKFIALKPVFAEAVERAVAEVDLDM